MYSAQERELYREWHQLNREQDHEIRRIQRAENRLLGIFTSPKIVRCALRIREIMRELNALGEVETKS